MDRIAKLQTMIELEKTTGKLYTAFGAIFAEDAGFWKKLAGEEESHASLLETLTPYIMDSKDLAEGLLNTERETLGSILARVKKILLHIGTSVSTREEALSIALQIEQSAGEAHYQKSLVIENASIPHKVFQSLASADKDHAQRILDRLDSLR